MRQMVCVIMSILLLPGCTATRYTPGRSDDSEIRLSGPRPGEEQVRLIRQDIRHHYFLFGLIPYEDDLNLARTAGLEEGESLVNTRITNHFDGMDILIFAGLGVITAGIGPLIWTTRTTSVRGEVVTTTKGIEAKPDNSPDDDTAPEHSDSGATAAAPAGAAIAGAGAAVSGTSVAAPAAKAPSASPKILTFEFHSRSANLESARSECSGSGGRLPTRAELKAHKSVTEYGNVDVWTSDGEDGDFWIYGAETGVTFLKSAAEPFPFFCVVTKGQ